MTVWKQLDAAIAFAAVAHGGQVRKYTSLPYVTHTIEVMQILHETAAVVSEDQLVAAVLHDTVEDTAVSIETIERRFGPGVASMVFDLTDKFTHEAYPDLNRAARKEREAARLGTISVQAQDIKLADLISNTASIVEHDPGFARTYLAEKARILGIMTAGDARLYRLAKVTLSQGQRALIHKRLENMP